MTSIHPYGAVWREIIGLNAHLCGKKLRPLVEQILGVNFEAGTTSNIEAFYACIKTLADLAGGLKEGNVNKVETYINMLKQIVQMPDIDQETKMKIESILPALEEKVSAFATVVA